MLQEAGAPSSWFIDLEPRSRYSPEMLQTPMERFFSGGVMRNPDPVAYKRARMNVWAKFGIEEQVEPWSIEKSAGEFELDKSAGLPYLVSKKEDLEGAIQRAYQCQKGKRPPPPVVWHRGKDTSTVRGVEGFPFEWHIVEGRFFYPFQRALLQEENPYFVERTRVDVSEQINRWAYDCSGFLTMDYSGFDGSISRDLIRDAFAVIKSGFNLNDQDRRLLNRIRDVFTTIPFLLPDGNIYEGRRHGIPSGSMFTQLIGSLVNAFIIEYIAQTLPSLCIGRYMVVGDDSIVEIRGATPNLDIIARKCYELGITLSKDKSNFNRIEDFRKVTFLGHYITSTAERDVAESLRKLVTPERHKREYTSTNKRVRYAAYAELVRGYLVDNRLAYTYLCRVLQVLEGHREKVRGEPSAYVYDRIDYPGPITQTSISRLRWDRSFRKQVLGSTSKQPVMGLLMWK
jgi:hypothetical protein